MSRRIQERKTGEEACGSKTEAYMFGVKNLLSVRRSDASHVPGIPQLDSNSVQGSTWKQVQGRDQNPATNGRQVAKRDAVQGGT